MGQRRWDDACDGWSRADVPGGKPSALIGFDGRDSTRWIVPALSVRKPDALRIGEDDDDVDTPLVQSRGSSHPNESPIDHHHGAARAQRMRRSLVYVGLFIGIGLCVGVSGPALPWITTQLPEGSSIATAFALRGLGGLFGSFVGAWALHHGLPGHAILVAGGILGAAGVASLKGVTSVGGVAAGLIALDGGCGFLQVANTLMAWIQPKENLVAWLNVLNGAFGIGTLLSPSAVAVLATLSGSHDTGVQQGLLLMPLVAATFVIALLLVPSPNDTAASKKDAAATGGWRYLAAGALTTVAVNGAVGAETTFAAFLVSYVGGQRRLGVLDVGDRQADMITSAFWFAFTTGRLGSGALYSVFSRAPYVALWCQICLMGSGLCAILLFPSSAGTLWTGAVMVGAGVAGLFAAFMGQLANNGIPIDSKVGGMAGVGVMTGVALWQAAAAAVDPRLAIHVVACACLTTASAQLALQIILRGGGCFGHAEERVQVNSDVEALLLQSSAERQQQEDGCDGCGAQEKPLQQQLQLGDLPRPRHRTNSSGKTSPSKAEDQYNQ